MIPRPFSFLGVLLCSTIWMQPLGAQTADASFYGPYNGAFIQSGLGTKVEAKRVLGDQWTIYAWIRADEAPVRTLLGGIGPTDGSGPAAYLALIDGKLALWQGSVAAVTSQASVTAGTWQFVAATSDGTTVRLYLEGRSVGQGAAETGFSGRTVLIAPDKLPWPDGNHFAGKVADFTITSSASSQQQIEDWARRQIDPNLIEFDAGSKQWPVQTRAQAGYRSPQDPATLPHSAAGPSSPVAKPISDAATVLTERGPNAWAIQGGWQMAAAGDIPDAGTELSTGMSDGKQWLHATVPGTVLTTYVDRGVYPDPDYGLNNLAIPEKLNKQKYWYRVEFTTPANLKHRRLTLIFNGINYEAAVFLNGKGLGRIRGAFIRGVFDVTEIVRPGGANTLAVLISPPPHPGIPQEQSVKAGPGENGGIQCLDGPTFVATEGWDWIPGIRDRNSGIWQDVILRATESVRIGDPQVVTALPLPDTSHADVFIGVPLHNDEESPVEGTLEASFEGVKISKNVTVKPGDSLVRLTPQEYQQLALDHPRLWWPNGYGRPELYHLTVAFRSGSHDSDRKSLRFGVREISYELSLLDSTGHLRRVEIAPTKAMGQSIVNVMHEGMIQTPEGWVSSLRPGAENSPAVTPVSDKGIAPYLAIKVNGVRIACKGGNWGMDDSRKRVSREHLEPFFRLHRDANLNIIRNWVGQDTEETFYDLADEYGLLVWNDFWDSTQNYNLEPDDSSLFLANARDVILRFRNHPSIVLWCGRNEGVPSPAVNQGLDDLIRNLDGTRYYSPSSNVVNLQNSGPYKYANLSDYFTKFANGFAVELGIPSMPTIDAFKAFVAPADQWPPNDVWAYHDWHASGNGVITPFMEAVATQFGEGKNLEDFERKAQFLNYDAHRAIFEGFNAHLWKPNSGRMLWMTQPAWPSTMWQILSSDYDTQASYYGVKKASEFVHVQMNLPDLKLAAVNETSQALADVTLRARVFSTAGTVVYTHEERLTIPPSSEADSFKLDLPEEVKNDVFFVKLELLDTTGRPLSDNFYAHAMEPANYRHLNGLPQVTMSGSASQVADTGTVRVDLTNPSSTVALMTKLTLRNAVDGKRVLPAYYSDNYVSLLPGEKRSIDIDIGGTGVKGPLAVGLSGWNVTAATVNVAK